MTAVGERELARLDQPFLFGRNTFGRARIAAQLVHHGKISRLDTKEGRAVLVPSAPEWHGSMDMANDLTEAELGKMLAASGSSAPDYRPVTPDDLAEVVDAFAEAVRRARDAGFDGVEIHGAHGYLISGFLSKAFNRRDDEYGGSIENRLRFGTRVLEAVRRAVGEAVRSRLGSVSSAPGLGPDTRPSASESPYI